MDSPYFNFISLEDQPELLRESFKLRHEVYCQELHFMPPEDYPDGLETDEYDPLSVHIGVVTKTRQDSPAAHHDQPEVIGTARLVRPSQLGMPLEGHCQEFYEDFWRGLKTSSVQEALNYPGLAEISRLAISARYRRRANDGRYALGHRATSKTDSVSSEADRRDYRPVIALGIYKALYQASKRHGISHWVAAMEVPLVRHLRRFQIVFRQIGPEVDYYGPVRPYLLSMAELEEKMSLKLPDMMEEWLEGLEPRHRDWYSRPAPDGHDTPEDQDDGSDT